jgi:hypothetical protein
MYDPILAAVDHRPQSLVAIISHATNPQKRPGIKVDQAKTNYEPLKIMATVQAFTNPPARIP